MQSATTYQEIEITTDEAACLGKADTIKLDFIPDSLRSQCRALIESYHNLHGYACLPNFLWRTRLGHLIETHTEFQTLLKKASTTRSAKKSNEGFVTIATAILAIEILASEFSGWSAMFTDARQAARRILDCRDGGCYTSLMDQYLYPPKFVNPAVIAALRPPPVSVRTMRSDVDPDRTAAGRLMTHVAALSANPN